MSKYTKIQAIFEMHQDEMQAQKMAKYMRDQFAFYGIPTKQRTSLTKTFLKAKVYSQSLPERKNFWYAFTRDQRSTLKIE